jgi:hypothetical protein
MAFYYGSKEQGFKSGYEGQIDRMRNQRIKNKELFDNWKKEKLRNGESVSVDDLIQQRETLAGGDNYFLSGLVTDAESENMAKRHNEQVASKIITEATGNMENQVKQQNIFEDAIGIKDGVTYNDYVKDASRFFGGDEAAARTAFDDMGGEDWFNNKQIEKRSLKAEDLIANDSRFTRAQSPEDLKKYFGNEPADVQADILAAWKKGEDDKRAAEVDKVEGYIAALNSDTLLYSDDAQIKQMIRGQYLNISDTDLDGLVSFWKGQQASLRTAKGNQQKSAFLKEIGSDKELLKIYGQQGVDPSDIMTRINEIGRKYDFLSETNWSTMDGFEKWIGDDAWLENTMKKGYTGQYESLEEKLNSTAVESGKAALDRSMTTVTQEVNDIRRANKEAGDDAPKEDLAFEEGGVASAALAIVGEKYILRAGGAQTIISHARELVKTDPNIGTQTLANALEALLMDGNQLQTLSEYQESYVQQGLEGEGYSIAPGETVQAYATDLTTSVDAVIEEISKTLQNAPSGSYEIVNGRTIWFGDTGESAAYQTAVTDIKAMISAVKKDFNNHKSALFSDMEGQVEIDGVMYRGSDAGQPLITMLEEKLKSLEAIHKTTKPTPRTSGSTNPATGLASDVETDYGSLGVDQSSRLPKDFDFMPMNDTAVNASFVSQTMEGLFDQDPQILAVAQTIISNQGNRSITEVARQLRNLIGSPKTNERTRPGGQGFWIHRQGAEFAPGEKKFYTKLARLLQAEAFSDE